MVQIHELVNKSREREKRKRHGSITLKMFAEHTERTVLFILMSSLPT
jgi:hypothetical protein